MAKAYPRQPRKAPLPAPAWLQSAPVRKRFLAPLAAALALGGCSLGDETETPPQLGTKSDDEDAAVKLGFPSSATKNTVRIGGGDSIADVAGVANVVFPATSDASRPTAVMLVDKDDWQGAIAASVLSGKPIGAPILLSDGGDLPPVSEDTLERLDPKGSDLARDAEVIRIGEDPPRPSGFKTALIEGDDPYERAAAIDRFASSARGEPSADVVVASGERPEYAMPAAAWAAFSGDSVLFTERSSVPEPTRKALREHEKPRIYLLGPESVISRDVERELAKLGRVRRIEGPSAVENAIAFTRYQSAAGDFGWAVTTAGHSFTVANSDRPLDAAGAAALTARGVPSPLLITDRADELPSALEDYFLNVQPGFYDDPREVAYSRAWILGDEDSFSVEAQVALEELVELIPIQENAP